MENLKAITNMVIQSLGSLHGPFGNKWFKNKVVILTDTSLDIIYRYPPNKDYEEIIKDPSNAFYLSHLRKNLSCSYGIPSNAVACPISRNSGEIIGFIGIEVNDTFSNDLLPFLEMLSVLIAYKYEKSNPANTFDLTDRERNIIHLISEGKKDREIAKSLNLSVSMIRFHINELFDKLNTRSRSELIKKYFIFND